MATNPKTLFDQAVEREFAANQKIVDQSVKKVLRLLATFRREVLAELADSEGFSARLLPQLIRAIEEAVVRLRDGMHDELAGASEQAIARATDFTRSVLAAVAIDTAIPLDVSGPLLLAVGETTASLVTNITEDLRRDLVSEIQQGTLGLRTPFETMERIRDKLAVQRARTRNGSYASRAEAIVRTEVGRAQSEAQQYAMEQAQNDVPDLAKQWRHSGNRNPRSGHVAANGQIVGVRERFVVAPIVGGRKENMLHPRDSAASAANVVRCMCQALPYLRRFAK